MLQKKIDKFNLQTFKYSVIILLFASRLTAFSQVIEVGSVRVSARADSTSLKGIDSLVLDQPDKSKVRLSPSEAIKFLQARQRAGNWKDPQDSLRNYIEQLLYYSTHSTVGRISNYFSGYKYDSLRVDADSFLKWDTIRFSIPGSEKLYDLTDAMLAKALAVHDTIPVTERDRVAEALSKKGRTIFPYHDTLLLILVDTLKEVSPERMSFPFTGYSNPLIGDSIEAAVEELLRFLYDRDSIVLNFEGATGSETSIWLNSAAETFSRFWLYNEYDDSVTVWIGNQGRNTLGLFLENNIQFRRPAKTTTIADAEMNIETIDSKALQKIQKAYVKPIYWKAHSEINFLLNQSLFSNWAKGGENSVAAILDVVGTANYNNTVKKLSWSNMGRLKHGFVQTEGTRLRRNADLIELNSKLNTKAFGKVDFSAETQFKTQLAKGYDYKVSDEIPVSKFFNPAIVSLGVGLDYKPDKETSFNMAPIAYKGTFVPDTADINQVKYGIDKDKRARHEPGGSILINHKFSPTKTITIANRLRLFSNYIDNPLNIDIDWELIATWRLNWFTEVRLNTNFIYDDDVKTVVYDKNDEPVLGPDGKPVKTARSQFKEVLGFSFVFRF